MVFNRLAILLVLFLGTSVIFITKHRGRPSFTIILTMLLITFAISTCQYALSMRVLTQQLDSDVNESSLAWTSCQGVLGLIDVGNFNEGPTTIWGPTWALMVAQTFVSDTFMVTIILCSYLIVHSDWCEVLSRLVDMGKELAYWSWSGAS